MGRSHASDGSTSFLSFTKQIPSQLQLACRVPAKSETTPDLKRASVRTLWASILAYLEVSLIQI